MLKCSGGCSPVQYKSVKKSGWKKIFFFMTKNDFSKNLFRKKRDFRKFRKIENFPYKIFDFGKEIFIFRRNFTEIFFQILEKYFFRKIFFDEIFLSSRFFIKLSKCNGSELVDPSRLGRHGVTCAKPSNC